MSDMLLLVLIRNDKVRCMNLTPYLNATKTENAWEESKHPRDKDGRFGKGSSMRPKTETPYVKGNEIFSPSDDIKTKREKVRNFYLKHFAGKTVKNKELGEEVYFSFTGFKKPLSFSADERKLKVFSILDEIVERGKIVFMEEDRYKRPNVGDFVVLKTEVVIEGKKESVRVSLRRDNNGTLYYDHVISQKK